MTHLTTDSRSEPLDPTRARARAHPSARAHSPFAARMARTKPTKVKRHVTSSAEPAAGGEAAAPAVDVKDEGVQADPAPEAAPATVKAKAVAARRKKQCDRCNERRERERNYARASRSRLRLAKAAANAEPSAPDATPASEEAKPEDGAQPPQQA